MPGARFELWKNRSMRFLLGASSTILTGLIGILRNKWFAHYLEASGIGILAQVVASQAWLGTAGGLGLGLPVARAVGAATAAGDLPGARRAFWAALTLLAISGSAVLTLGLLFAGSISRALLGTDAYTALIRISMVGVAGVALHQMLFGLFAGRSDLKAPFAFALVGGSVSLTAAFFMVPRWGLKGAVLAAAVFFSAGCAGALLVQRREYGPLMRPPAEPAVTPGLARSLLTVAGAGLLSALIEQGTLLTLRSHYVRANGVEANGFLQAGIAISQQVGALFYAYLGSYAFGKISGVAGAEATRDYTRKHWAPLLLLAALALIATRLGAGTLLRLLYSHRFDPAQPLMAWALLGEYGRIGLLTWALGALPLGGARLWFPISLVFPATLAVAYAAFATAGAGALSLPKAYAAAGIAAACVGGAVMARRGVTLGARDLLVFACGATALLALAVAAGGAS